MNDSYHWRWMIQIIEDEWLRFIENEWFRLLKMNDLDYCGNDKVDDKIYDKIYWRWMIEIIDDE